MRLVDTHCHLQAAQFDVDRDAVLGRSLDVLDWLVVIGDNLSSSEAALRLCGPRVYATVGIHPYHAASVDERTIDALRQWAELPCVKAIGEIGLDYYNEYAPREVQARAFREQLELAAAVRLPVVIHNRDADDDVLAMLGDFAHRLPGCVMHCFGSDAPFAHRCVELGFHVSFAGNVTFPKAASLREAAEVVPLDRLLIETDAPYLAPPPMRGKRCEPQFVRYTAEVLAGVKGVSLEEMAEHTTANAERFYRLGQN